MILAWKKWSGFAALVSICATCASLPAAAQTSAAPSRKSAAELHAAGVTAFNGGLYSLATLSFYDLYTQYPNDKLAPHALFQVARSLVQLNKAGDACIALAELRGAYGDLDGAADLERQLDCFSSTPRIPPVTMAKRAAGPQLSVSKPAVTRSPTTSPQSSNRPLGPSQTAIDLGLTDLELTQKLCAGTITLPAPARNANGVRAKVKAEACREVADYKAASLPKKPDWSSRIGTAYAQSYVRAPGNTFGQALGMTTASGSTAINNIMGVVTKTFTYNVRNATCKIMGRAAACSFEISTNQRAFLGQSQIFSYSSPWKKQSLTFDDLGGALRSSLLDRQMASIVADQARNSSNGSPSSSGPTKGDRCRADAMTMLDWGASGSAAAKSMFCGL